MKKNILIFMGLLLTLKLNAQTEYRSLEVVSEHTSQHTDVKNSTFSCELITYTRKLSGFKLSNVERLYVPEENKEKKFAELTKASSLEINVFPNPASSYIEIECLHFEGKSAVLSVCTNTGQEVMNQKISTQEVTKVDISGLAKGYYTVTVTQNSKTQAHQIILKQ